jgi:hypothetical protein
MKLSAYHKGRGDAVEFVNFGNRYDVVYKSKVFSFTPDDVREIETDLLLRGGTGYDTSVRLPEDVEHTCPDYGLYLFRKWADGNTALGYTTRGCINRCPWCVVPQKEGALAAHADIDEFMGGKQSLVLLDNNILAHPHGLAQIVKIADGRIPVDFNQGLDFRQFSPEVIDLLGRVKYRRYLRISCDTASMLGGATEAIGRLKAAGIRPYKVFVYCLVQSDLAEAHRRITELARTGVTVFAMPYRDYSSDDEIPAAHRNFARWVNHKAIFNSCTWDEYRKRKSI